MTTWQTEEIRISGTLVGPIWWPAGAECWRDVSWDATDYECRCGEPLTLREHVDALLTNEGGDFQHCAIADGVLTIVRRRGSTRRVRTFPLDRFPSIADMRRDEWDGPCFPEDEDF